MVNEKQNDWDLHLDPVLFAIRTSVHCSTKFSPFRLLYNREARRPVQLENNGEDWSNVSVLRNINISNEKC